MNEAVLGANWSLFAGAMSQAVVPATGLPSPSVQVNAAPPHSWTSIPRCRLYQACSAGASLALKKMPPIPVPRFMEPPTSGGGEGSVWSAASRARSPRRRQHHIPILDRRVIPLQQDRSRTPLVAVECAAGDAGNGLLHDDRVPVEHNRHQSPDERDIAGLPFAGRERRVFIGHEEPVHAAFVMTVGLHPLAVLHLHFVTAAKVDAAVAALGHAKLHVQPE